MRNSSVGGMTVFPVSLGPPQIQKILKLNLVSVLRKWRIKPGQSRKEKKTFVFLKNFRNYMSLLATKYCVVKLHKSCIRRLTFYFQPVIIGSYRDSRFTLIFVLHARNRCWRYGHGVFDSFTAMLSWQLNMASCLFNIIRFSIRLALSNRVWIIQRQALIMYATSKDICDGLHTATPLILFPSTASYSFCYRVWKNS